MRSKKTSNKKLQCMPFLCRLSLIHFQFPSARNMNVAFISIVCSSFLLLFGAKASMDSIDNIVPEESAIVSTESIHGHREESPLLWTWDLLTVTRLSNAITPFQLQRCLQSRSTLVSSIPLTGPPFLSNTVPPTHLS